MFLAELIRDMPTGGTCQTGEHDPDMWSGTKAELHTARELCHSCPALADCRVWRAACLAAVPGYFAGAVVAGKLCDAGGSAPNRKVYPHKAPADSRWCPKCMTCKPLGMFHTRDGGGKPSSYCKSCNNARPNKKAA